MFNRNSFSCEYKRMSFFVFTEVHAEPRAEAPRRSFYGCYCGYYRNMAGFVRVTVVRMANVAPWAGFKCISCK